MSDQQLVDVLSKQPGWQYWMLHWVLTQPIPDGFGNAVPLYCCYYPDNTMFYASTDPAQAVAAFGRKEFAYNG